MLWLAFSSAVTFYDSNDDEADDEEDEDDDDEEDLICQCFVLSCLLGQLRVTLQRFSIRHNIST